MLFYLFMILLDGILSPGQLTIAALMLAIDLSFLIGSFKLIWNDELSLNEKLTSQLLKGKLPQLWSGSTWLAPGYGSVQFSSVAQSCPTLCDPMNRSTPGLPVYHQLLEFTQTHVHRVVMPSSHLILCYPLFLLPPIPLSIRVFSNESTLCMRWPKYWSFSFSIIPFKEHPGLISFRMD